MTQYSFIIFNWNFLNKINVKDKLKVCPDFLANYNRLSYSKCTSKVKCIVPNAWVLQQPALYAERFRITKCANRIFPKSWVDHVEKKILLYSTIIHESRVCYENEIKNLFFERKFVVVSCSDQLGFHSQEHCYLERIDFATLIQWNKFDC